MHIRFKCFCSSIKLKVEELLWNIYLEITSVEKLLEKQLAENWNFSIEVFKQKQSPESISCLRNNVIQEYGCGKDEQIKASLRS